MPAMGMRHETIMIGLSGGVDSAVAALCLLEAGHRVEAIHMTNWEDEDGYCGAADDYQSALQVSRDLGIPLHRVNFAPEYRERVFAHFLHEYRAGRTPNPDILCNREIKFGVFQEHALRLGGDAIATGHYARLETESGRTRLLTAADTHKDQTYFLHAVPGQRLGNARFPLGELVKKEVRELAARAGLSNHSRRDSTGICFIGERPFRDFLSQYVHAEPGDIETPEGDLLGRHVGLSFYTLGQRQGLGIGGQAGTSGKPWYVAGKKLADNVLIAVQGRQHPMLWSAGLTATENHWVSGVPPKPLGSQQGMSCQVKTRYRQQASDCRAWLGADGRLSLQFADPLWAVTPGQSAVLYDHCGICLNHLHSV